MCTKCLSSVRMCVCVCLQITEEQLSALFAEFGSVTDCCMKRTPAGEFRRFAFLGFREPDAAALAVSRLDRSFIGVTRIRQGVYATLKTLKTP